MYRHYLQLVTTETFSGGDFWVPLDDSVEPGRSWQGVLGAEWNPSRRYQLSLEGYYTDLANLVVIDQRRGRRQRGDALGRHLQKRRQRLGPRGRALPAAGEPGP